MISFPRRRVAAALLAVAAAFGCSRDNPSAPPSLQGVVVIAPDSTIFVGQTVTATAVGVSQYGDTMALKNIKWSSNPSSVATVDDNGVITAIKPGNAVITAKSQGKTGELNLTVSNAPAALTTINVTLSGDDDHAESDDCRDRRRRRSIRRGVPARPDHVDDVRCPTSRASMRTVS